MAQEPVSHQGFGAEISQLVRDLRLSGVPLPVSMSQVPEQDDRGTVYWEVDSMARWTDKEIACLKRYYPQGGWQAAQKHIDRSQGAITAKAWELGIKRVGKWESNIERNLVLLRLYEQGLNDREIAEQVGLRPPDICRWRQKHGFPAHFHRKRWDKPIKLSGGVPMEKALNPAQCRVMRQFLRDLLDAAREAQNCKTYNVSRFMRTWREIYGGRGRRCS